MTDDKLYVWELELDHEDSDYGYPEHQGLFSCLEYAIETCVNDTDHRFGDKPIITHDIKYPEVWESQVVDSYFYKIYKLEIDKYRVKDSKDGNKDTK